MPSNEVITVESLTQRANELGMTLTNEEAIKLLAGVKRNQEFARLVRSVVAGTTEPAPVFNAASKEQA